MAQQLLIEYSVFTPKKTQITEGIAGGKNLMVEGIVQRAEEFNHNGRRYPFDILKREVDKYIVVSLTESWLYCLVMLALTVVPAPLHGIHALNDFRAKKFTEQEVHRPCSYVV